MNIEWEQAKATMAHLDFPAEAIDTLSACMDRMASHAEFCAQVERFCADPTALRTALAEVKEISAQTGENEYTLDMVLLLGAAPVMREHYRTAGLPDALYWDSIADLKWKLRECHECKDVWGTFVAPWFDRFYGLTRFALGRFQYETSEFGADYFEKEGHVLRRGDPVINIHIPSCGPLTDEVRMDSYRRAFAFYGGKPGEPMAFVCHSWLLYPEHRSFLPPTSNILRFMNDFDIIESAEDPAFGDGWRVFGKYAGGPVDRLPQTTSLQRAFVQRLREGKPTGFGYGVLFFDGVRILGK